MKIALLGAPSSGKTKVAKAIARRMNEYDLDGAPDRSRGHDRYWAVVDGYVERLAKRSGLTYGVEADWPMNVQVMGHRWEAEAHAVKDGSNAICCGTIYETMVYGNIHSLLNMRQPATEREMLAVSEYHAAMMSFMGAMENTTVDYDVMFYLPFEGDSHTWEGVVDAKIDGVLEAFYRKAYTLPGTTKEKADAATEAIREIQRVTTVPPTPDVDPRGDSGDREEGSEDRSVSEQVSDL
jgi:hypothetical protein